MRAVHFVMCSNACGGGDWTIGYMRDGSLTGKYVVAREDGKFNAEARYFVLNYASDPYAWAAMRAYAEACSTTYPILSADLLATVAYHEEEFAKRKRSDRPARGKQGAGGTDLSGDDLVELLRKRLGNEPALAQAIGELLGTNTAETSE